MDLITHALLLYLLGRFLGLEKRTQAALVLGGISPDLDFWLSWPGSILSPNLLLVHRGITHSLLFGTIFGLLLLYLAALPRAKGLSARFGDCRPGVSWGSVAAVSCGVMIHLLMDYTTTRGVPMLFPWQMQRYSADIFFQIEPIVLAASIIVAAALLRSRALRSKKNMFVVFLLFLLVVGAVRIDGKMAAEESLPKNATVHPGPGLFSWAALWEEEDRYMVSRYDLLAESASAASAFPRLRAVSSRDEALEALAHADDLPQVGLFRWRAYAVAVNATASGNGSWDIEYYDPLVRAEAEGSGSFFRMQSGRYGSVRAVVEDGRARMAIDGFRAGQWNLSRKRMAGSDEISLHPLPSRF
jgi:inner membrane protein